MTDKLKPHSPATLTLDDKTYTLPTYMGVEGEKAIDITKLRQNALIRNVCIQIFFCYF